jgi:DNA-binding transcriptional MerR regulator
MNESRDRRHKISEVSKMLDVPVHVLRQWESRFPQLKPERDRANRRYYLSKHIDVVRRIKHLLWHEKMTTEGARLQLAQELYGEGCPKTSQEVEELLDKVRVEVRSMIDLLDSTKT